MGTFVTILLGTMFGGFLVRDELGRQVLAISLVALVRDCLCRGVENARRHACRARSQDRLESHRPDHEDSGLCRERYDVFWAVLGASWFWFLGTVLLVQFPVFTKDVLLGNDVVANIFIALFTVGIGAGSLLTNMLLKGEVSARYVPSPRS